MVPRAAGLSGSAEWSTSAIFFDADADGWLDLYAGNYVVWSPDDDLVCTIGRQVRSYCTPELYEGLSGRFYRNNGYGVFTDQTEAAGFASAPGKTLAVAEADFNGDNRPDLVVVNDTQRDLLFENRGARSQQPGVPVWCRHLVRSGSLQQINTDITMARLATFQYPQDPDRWWQLAALLRSVGRLSEARQAYDVARSLTTAPTLLDHGGGLQPK